MELYIWAWLAIWLAGLWVGIGEGIIARKSLDIMGKNPDISWTILVLTILGIALTESAAIYGLIIALQIIGLDPSMFAPWVAIWAWLAVWAAWMWVWIWEWMLVSWAMWAIQRNPEMKWKIMTFMVLFLALVESAAIYWLVVALMLLWKEAWPIGSQAAIWAWFAVWLAWLWVWIWEWLIAKKSLQSIWKSPESSGSFLITTVLGIALTESAAIYGLIIALQIIGLDPTSIFNGVIWAWLAVWAAWLWVWIWEWMLVSWAMDAIQKNPAIKWKIMTFMVLFLALVESAAIYWLVIALMLLWIQGEWIAAYSAIWAWLAIWIAWLWAWVWEWIIAKKSLELTWKNPDLTGTFLIITILGVALVEASAIYGLIIALQIIGLDPSVATLWMTIWAGIAVGAAGLWVGKWFVSEWALWAIQRNPAIKAKIMTFMVLFLALVESVAIYGLVVSLWLLSG